MSITEKRLAIGYIRVSTEGQLDGYGLQAQRTAIQTWAESNDYQLVEVFEERGVSGTNELENRVALAEARDYLREHPDVQTVIIPELSRLARDLMVQETILGDFGKIGCTVVSVKEPDLCSNDPTRVLIRQVLGAINQYDRSMIIARMKSGRITKALGGQHAIGSIPLGYKSETVDGRKQLVVDPVSAHLVKRIFHMKDKRKLSFQKIADTLNAERIPTPKGGAMWHASAVHKIYNNPKYRGIVTYTENGETLVNAKNEGLRIL